MYFNFVNTFNDFMCDYDIYKMKRSLLLYKYNSCVYVCVCVCVGGGGGGGQMQLRGKSVR